MQALLKSFLLFFVISLCSAAVVHATSAQLDGAGTAVSSEPPIVIKVEPACAFPSEAKVLKDRNGALLKVWRFKASTKYTASSVPEDSGLLEYQRYIASLGGDAKRPPLKVPAALSDEEKQIWDAEVRNNESIHHSQIGSIEPISCLDALLFSEQNRRVPQIDAPTEFIASVLSRVDQGEHQLLVVFGAGLDMFPPKSVYGLEVVQEAVGDGWEYSYMIHNHTIQNHLNDPVPGVPAT
ncbi:hypothetical protein CSC67_01020 [Pusillimonas caeni]|uniref:hypothetical protein n=1 Tax=Pusillimonas caeni TaxID=1348472 RepID=UPI0010751EE3|nr:hypothetical protein [Pusillimonas caeni]TFL15345.1 hypothetical protein CSC67_01020 [Pusillimonas caeni]